MNILGIDVLGSGFVIILAIVAISLFLNFVPIGLWISAMRPMFGTKSWEDRQTNRVRKERKSFFAAKNSDDDKLISMPLAKTQVKVVVIEPINFDDAQKVADYLRKNQPVVVNFEDTDSDVMKRIVDFVSGTIYALNGSMKKIGRNIMVCAPQNVDIDAGNTAYGDRSDSP